MTIGILACSRKAYELMQKLRQKLEQCQSVSDLGQITIIEKVKCSGLPEQSMTESFTECVGHLFQTADVLIFICAAGIAVRSIAPYIGHKSQDPAVVVLDELGTFSISLLSGHAGGANEWAERIAAMVGAVPVITTATDREGKFAVDDFARKNRLLVTDWKRAKEVSVDVLAGRRITIYTELPTVGKIPQECEVVRLEKTEKSTWDEKETNLPEECFKRWSEHDIVISANRMKSDALHLIPKNIVIGVGCRKGTTEDQIAYAVEQCLKEEQIDSRAVAMVASIDLKKEEAGLVRFCQNKKWPFLTYTAEELNETEGEFAVSEFVEKVTGVSCVCERSAVCAAEGRLLCHKRVFDGVTIALACKEQTIVFDS